MNFATTAVAAAMIQAAPANRGLMIIVIYIVSFGLIAWFLLIRPQKRMQEQHRAMMEGLKRNDEVMTEGGIIGTIVHLAEDRVTLKSGDTRIIVARHKITRILTAPEAPAAQG